MRDITSEVAASREAAEALSPSEEIRVWHVKGADANGVEVERQYIQEQLSFFGKQELITLLNSYVDRFISGEFGELLSQLFVGGDARATLRDRIEIPTEFNAEIAEGMVKENAGMIRSIIKAVNELPGLQQEIMMLSLGVPSNERKWATAIITGPVSRGGLDDEQGFDILATFVSQNARHLRSFFVERGRAFVDHVQRELFPETVKEQATEQATEPDPVEKSTSEQPEMDQDSDTPGGTPLSTSSQAIPVSG